MQSQSEFLFRISLKLVWPFPLRVPLHTAFPMTENVTVLIKSTPVASCPQWDTLFVSVLQFTMKMLSLSECQSTKSLIYTYMFVCEGSDFDWERWIGLTRQRVGHEMVWMYDVIWKWDVKDYWPQ